MILPNPIWQALLASPCDRIQWTEAEIVDLPGATVPNKRLKPLALPDLPTVKSGFWECNGSL